MRIGLQIIVLSILGLFTIPCHLVGRNSGEVTAKSEKHFDRIIDKRTYAVALFYYEDKQMRREGELAAEIDDLESVFSGVSREALYQEAEVPFVLVNLSRRDLDDIAIRFGLHEDVLPVVLLYRNGVPLRDSNGQLVKLHGYPRYEQLHTFIKKWLKAELEDEAERLYDEAEERRRERRHWAGVYYSPYWYGPSWGWPYYGDHYWW